MACLRLLLAAALTAPAASFSFAPAFSPACRSGLAASLRAPAPPLRTRKGAVGLRASGVPEEEEGLTLTAYDQLVLSIRSLTVAEIKQELSTRGVGFDDCFEKEALVARLTEARLQLAAEAMGEGELEVDDEGSVSAKPLDEKDIKDDPPEAKPNPVMDQRDALKDALNPESIQALLQDQELLAALRDPAVMRMAQEVMKDPSKTGEYAADPAVRKALDKVQAFLTAQKKGGSSL
eukprot:CAMPEP_0180130908 /NCGR_PEP_ID=MMETSP0986-20121125/8129_1 /TAXON_ID=697907 /ORGANISM="non described non described, Strain CCMP2293" /LENGTH=234 /DNA_ID=CAMNT_0022070733 /DNA_START=31 /DNA_END=735 /DNA_ORIENTATION=+